MKIDIEQTIVTGPESIRLSHAGRSMIWDTKTYNKSSDRKSPMNPHLIFQEINGFWATLPLKVQEQFWNLYCEARDELDSTYDIKELRTRLQDIAARLFSIPELDGLDHWVRHRSGVRFPSDLKDSFDDVLTDNISYPHRKEKTYLKEEYIALAVLTVKMRMMVPIWAEFIRITRKEVGGNSKELEAFRLLYHTNLDQNPAMIRLQRYVHLTVTTLMGNELPATAILNGMGVNEYMDWMLATCVVRRLAMCPIGTTDEVSNIITNVYQYVKLGVKGGEKKHGRKFGGRVNLRAPEEMSEDRGRRSVAEINKVKQLLPDGMRVFLNVYTENERAVLLRVLGLTRKGSHELTSPMPEGLFERLDLCIAAIEKVPNFEIEKHHITLTQWTLSRALSPKGVPLLQFENIKRMIAVAQCALWEWGFFDLAALITAQAYDVDDDTMIGASETRGKIPKEALELMTIRWPHTQASKGKQSVRQSNTAARGVDALSDILTENDWELHCPRQLADRLERATRGRRMATPADIRHTLSYLLIKLDDNSKEEV